MSERTTLEPIVSIRMISNDIFLRKPLKHFEEMEGLTIVSVHKIETANLIVFTKSFILFVPEALENEYGNLFNPHITIVSDPEAIRSIVGLDNCLKFGLVDVPTYESWKRIIEQGEEAALQNALNRDYRRYLELQKVFEQVWEEHNGRWIRKNP